MIPRRPGLALLFLSVLPAGAVELAVEIEGLKGDALESARGSLTLWQFAGRDPTPAQVRRLFARGEAQIRTALEPHGYYDPRIEGRLEETDKGFRAVYSIDPGKPVVVREARVYVRGEAADSKVVRAAIDAFEPGVGDRLDHALYEQSKAAIESTLLSEGYLAADFTSRRVEVTRRTRSAVIDLGWESGPRHRFGEVRFGESQFPPEFLQRFVPWEEGAHYSNDQLLTLQQRLVDASYFSTVAVQPDIAAAKDAVVPVDVLLVPAKRSVYTIGAYVSTDTGPGARLGYERRWVNRRGHKLRVDLESAQRLQAAALSYRIPRPGPKNRSFNFGAAYRDEDTDTSESQALRIAANETREWRDYTRTLGLQYIDGNFEVGGEPGSSKLLFAEGVLSRKNADDFFFPHRGISLAYTLRFAPEGLVSDTSFVQLAADAKLIRSPRERERLILRASLGAMTVDDFSRLPPELRFFAGGDRSVRGFDYQALGTTNALGEVIGGEFLAVASVEYEHYFLANWGAAVFVDAGDAFMSSEFDLNVGAGIGVRWKSPVGVVRVDFAKPVRSELADVIRFHVQIGPDL